jgi:hypothetical protein
MKPDMEEQLTTEGQLLCGAIIVAALVEEGRVGVVNTSDAEAARNLRLLLKAMLSFREEAKHWPEATN